MHERKISVKVSTVQCENCGAALKIRPGQRSFKCEYCDSELHISKKLFDELNAAEDILRENENREQLDRRNAVGEKAYKADMRVWDVALIIWIAIIGIGLWLSEMPAWAELADEFWPSLLIIGGPSLIAGKPRRAAYMKFAHDNDQEKFFRWASLWRKLLFGWALVMSVCWGLPESCPVEDTLFSIGMVLLLLGLIFFIRFRPTKRRFLIN